MQRALHEAMATPVMRGYVLGELLGRGGMGAVYAARQPSLGRTVAVKLMHPELAANPTIIERFRTEALAGGRLSHPNVARVFDFGVTVDGTPYLVMERIAGEDLRSILDREGALPPHRACELALQILAALTATHLAAVVHADVKSDNILVERTSDGRDVATLIDFGIARLMDQPAIARDGIVSGTAEYLAPEVITGGQPTVSTDLYAMGTVLYELLTGETPFHGGSMTDVFRRQLGEDVIAPSLRCPEAGISLELDRVVLCALAKKPELRFATAGAFSTDLAAALRTSERVEFAATGPRGFATEAPTQDWAEVPRRRLAAGTHPQPQPNPAERLRSAIGAALVVGDREAIATSYLDLARALVAARHSNLAVGELEEAIDVLTAGAGPAIATPPPSLWRVLLALSAIHDGTGDREEALAAARYGRAAAIHARSSLGRDRARVLLQRLARSVPA